MRLFFSQNLSWLHSHIFYFYDVHDVCHFHSLFNLVSFRDFKIFDFDWYARIKGKIIIIFLNVPAVCRITWWWPKKQSIITWRYATIFASSQSSSINIPIDMSNNKYRFSLFTAQFPLPKFGHAALNVHKRGSWGEACNECAFRDPNSSSFHT